MQNATARHFQDIREIAGSSDYLLDQIICPNVMRITSNEREPVRHDKQAAVSQAW